MSKITLNSAVEVAPAIPAITTNEISILSIQENYGWGDQSQPGSATGMGRHGTVEADVLLDAERNIQRRITVWEGEDYLAVRGTWTDETLAARIAEILGA